MATIETIIPRNQTTYMFLGEHTKNTAKKLILEYDQKYSQLKNTEILSNSDTDSGKIAENKEFESSSSRIITVGDPGSFHLSHFYPVLPRDYVIGTSDLAIIKNTGISTKNAAVENIESDKNTKSENNIIESQIIVENNSTEKKIIEISTLNIERKNEKNEYHPFFVMQGNFGGKHSHRKDPKGTLNCIRKIEEKIKLEILSKTNEVNSSNKNDMEKRNLKTRNKMNIYNDEKIKQYKKRLLNEIISTNNSSISPNISAFNKKPTKINKINLRKMNEKTQNYAENDGFSPVEFSAKSLSIDLVGHLNGKVDVGTLRTGRVRFLSDLGSKDYYEAISKVNYFLWRFFYFL